MQTTAPQKVGFLWFVGGLFGHESTIFYTCQGDRVANVALVAALVYYIVEFTEVG